jgi:hypothetical protein
MIMTIDFDPEPTEFDRIFKNLRSLHTIGLFFLESFSFWISSNIPLMNVRDVPDCLARNNQPDI